MDAYGDRQQTAKEVVMASYSTDNRNLKLVRLLMGVILVEQKENHDVMH